MKKLAFLLFLLQAFSTAVFSQWTLGEKAEIHVVTCGPYQGELYSAFGHSAIRVLDPDQGLDLIFNYGVFDFNQPNFYLNFARGYLNYQLAVAPYDLFKRSYISENRFIHEQSLNLDQDQKQKVFDFLQWNALPENRSYMYDYFYDNCATRVRDVFSATLGEELRFDSSFVSKTYTVRELCDQYLAWQPWGDLGIDLCLGLPMDKEMRPYEYMFLPDYTEEGFNAMEVYRNGRWEPLVKETLLTHDVQPETLSKPLWNPLLFFSIISFLGIFMTYMGYRRKRLLLGIDLITFSVVGFLGWLLFLLWVLTDHNAAAKNFNLLWALPVHFPLVLFLYLRNRVLLGQYFRAISVFYAFVLILWPFLPQNLHFSLIPLVLLLLVRSLYSQFHLLRKS